MSFLKNSLDFSLVDTIKEKYLYKELQKYNDFKTNLTKITYKEVNNFIIIPNNNIKYFCFIIPKNLIDNKNSKYSILYFFPQKKSNEFTDFFIEADLNNQHIQLYEGYLYNTSKTEFLLTDILIDSDIIPHSYPNRLDILKKNYYENLSKITNGNINIQLHNLCNDINTIDIFRKNFKYITCALEYIYDFEKKQNILTMEISNETFIIRKTDISEIYQLFDKSHNTFIGILYIKTLNDSYHIKTLFETNFEIIHECKFNSVFNKWELYIVSNFTQI